ncbi:MAG: hypothetical protein KF901_08295 [Myxococcales bacterium]|nr:hypothetical protein [Myxococcales bacterium]
MTLDHASWGAQEPIFTMLQEICRLNRGRPSGEEIRLVLSVDASLPGGFQAELSRRGCGTDEDGAPRWVTLRQGGQQIWTQDVMEFVEVELERDDGTRARTTAVWDTPQRRTLSVDALAMEERYPFLGLLGAAEGPQGDQGGAGGNIESFPNGRFLVGDTAPGPLQAWVLSRGGLIVPSDFLHVGHVDEWISVRADGVAVYAHPLQALEVIVRASDAEWEEMQRALLRMAEEADVLAVERDFANYALLHVRRSDIVDSITHFLRDPAKRPPYRVADFDLTRADRLPGTLPRVGWKRNSRGGIADMGEFRTRFADFIVRGNVRVFDEHILPGLVTLSNAGVRTQPAPELQFGRGSALPSMINAVWLDDVVVTADPGFAPFRRAFEAAVGRRVAWTNGTMTWYLDGGVHCMTQVSRRPPCEPVAKRGELIFDHDALECVCLAGGDPERGCETSGCDRATSCSECNGVGFEGCGWCPGTGCVAVTAGVATECETALWTRLAQCIDCEAATSPTQCRRTAAECAWCEGTGSCVNGAWCATIPEACGDLRSARMCE